MTSKEALEKLFMYALNSYLYMAEDCDGHKEARQFEMLDQICKDLEAYEKIKKNFKEENKAPIKPPKREPLQGGKEYAIVSKDYTLDFSCFCIETALSAIQEISGAIYEMCQNVYI